MICTRNASCFWFSFPSIDWKISGIGFLFSFYECISWDVGLTASINIKQNSRLSSQSTAMNLVIIFYESPKWRKRFSIAYISFVMSFFKICFVRSCILDVIQVIELHFWLGNMKRNSAWSNFTQSRISFHLIGNQKLCCIAFPDW